jgi:hypothetical protein
MVDAEVAREYGIDVQDPVQVLKVSIIALAVRVEV